MQVSMPGAQWGQIHQNIGVWNRERFIAGSWKETGGSRPPKSLTLWRVSAKCFKKSSEGRGGTWSAGTVLWLADGWEKAVMSQGLTSFLRLQEAWGHGLMVLKLSNIFCLVGGFHIWIFIGRTDAKAETSILWPPNVKNWLIGKDPDSGNDWRREGKGTTEGEMVGWHHWLNGHEFE